VGNLQRTWLEIDGGNLAYACGFHIQAFVLGGRCGHVMVEVVTLLLGRLQCCSPYSRYVQIVNANGHVILLFYVVTEYWLHVRVSKATPA